MQQHVSARCQHQPPAKLREQLHREPDDDYYVITVAVWFVSHGFSSNGEKQITHFRSPWCQPRASPFLAEAAKGTVVGGRLPHSQAKLRF